MTESTTETPVTTTSKPQQTASITLSANDSIMTIVAERKAEGARTYVITTDADKKSQRGMTEQHSTFEAAEAAIEKMAKAAAKGGWKRKEKRRGFVAKPDAFTALPAPPPVAKAKK